MSGRLLGWADGPNGGWLEGWLDGCEDSYVDGWAVGSDTQTPCSCQTGARKLSQRGRRYHWGWTVSWLVSCCEPSWSLLPLLLLSCFEQLSAGVSVSRVT